MMMDTLIALSVASPKGRAAGNTATEAEKK